MPIFVDAGAVIVAVDVHVTLSVRIGVERLEGKKRSGRGREVEAGLLKGGGGG